MVFTIRTTLYTLLFISLATMSLASPSPIDLPDVAASPNNTLSRRSALLPAGAENAPPAKRGRKHKHRKPKQKSRTSKGNNRIAAKGVRHSGDATYFDVGMGACGHRNSNSDMIAAASHVLYDSYPGATANPNNNPICGRRLRATYRGRSVVVSIVDRCEACEEWALDFSPRAFNKLGRPDDGRLHGMSWEWI